ncbi:hypothetical protein WMY93_028940 [Mugilogobius chulae]|uniref:Uncharacterized protein n=1 Tax=Mugilogobius chulae TaxID=88201 RepID=A0AAW0MVY7_9GOBI
MLKVLSLSVDGSVLIHHSSAGRTRRSSSLHSQAFVSAAPAPGPHSLPLLPRDHVELLRATGLGGRERGWREVAILTSFTQDSYCDAFKRRRNVSSEPEN